METIVNLSSRRVIVSEKQRPIVCLSDYVTEKMPKLIWQEESYLQLQKEVAEITSKTEVIQSLSDVLNLGSQKTKELALLDLKFLDAAMYFSGLTRDVLISSYIKKLSSKLELVEVLNYEELIFVNPQFDCRTFSDIDMRYDEVLFYTAHSNYEKTAEEIITILHSVVSSKGKGLTAEVVDKFDFLAQEAILSMYSTRGALLNTESFNKFRKFFSARPDIDCLGSSGAFTITIPVIDMLYSGNQLVERFGFYKERMNYYPREWRRFMLNSMKEVEQGIFVSLFDLANGSDSDLLLKLVHRCSNFLVGFRSGHYNVVKEHLTEEFNGSMGYGNTSDFLKNRLNTTKKIQKNEKRK